MAWGIPVYVAENDAKAREEFEPHLRYFVVNCMKGLTLSPPGYTSAKSALAIMKNRKHFLSADKTWKDLEEGVYCIVGSPQTVRDKLNHYRKELGVGVILTGCQVGSIPHELARKSMTMFAEEVLPWVR
jgi:alkanesulfonate monooxygenase SsuD/methylene tetrahydromethanopterin reductase-like flavin-dependent oxidoreductase (luciferase family)